MTDNDSADDSVWLAGLKKALVGPAPDELPKETPAQVVIREMHSRYEFIHCQGEPYAVAKVGMRVAIPFGGELRRTILQVSAYVFRGMGRFSKSAVDTVVDNLRVLAFYGDETPSAFRFCDDRETNRILIDLGDTDGKCVYIETEGWEVTDIPRDVVFRRAHTTKPLPEPKHGGSLADLADVLSLDWDSETFALMVGWVIGLPFVADVQPGLLLIGPPGTGKSTRLRHATSIFEPSDTGSLGGMFGKKADDDQVRALHRAVPLWDNLNTVAGTTSDLLCTIVTGTAREGRRLYSDADISTRAIKRPVGLSAIDIPPGFRPDALDRLIVSEVPAIVNKRSDSAVQDEFDALHPTLLGAACDAAAAVLRHRNDVGSYVGGFRMAAYAEVLSAVDVAVAGGELVGIPPLLKPYGAQWIRTRGRTVAEDVFGSALIALLRDKKNHGMWGPGTATELLDAVLWFKPHSNRDNVGWPSSPKAVATTLGQLKQGLNDMGITWTTRLLDGRTRYAFTHSNWLE